MGWQRVCALLGKEPWWSPIARDPRVVLLWEGDTLVVRWAGNPALWIESVPEGLLLRTREEYLSLSPPSYRVVLDAQPRHVSGIIRTRADLIQRYHAFRRRVMRYPHPHGVVVDTLALREPCVTAVAPRFFGRVPVDMVISSPDGVASCWLVRRAEDLRTEASRGRIAHTLIEVRAVLAHEATGAHLRSIWERWAHVPAVFARRRSKVEAVRLATEPVLLITGFLPELRPQVSSWAAALHSFPLVCLVADPAHFGPRHWVSFHSSPYHEPRVGPELQALAPGGEEGHALDMAMARARFSREEEEKEGSEGRDLDK